jgi:hypothetical protein
VCSSSSTIQRRPARKRPQHVGIGRDHARARSRGATLVGGRVTVVGRDPDPRARGQASDERTQRRALIARERLGREQQQRPRLAIAQGRVEDRELEAQALARRGAGGDDHVAAAQRRIDRDRLVLERTREISRLQHRKQSSIQPIRPTAECPRSCSDAVLDHHVELRASAQRLGQRIELSAGRTAGGNVSFSRARSCRGTVACPQKEDPSTGEA